MQGQTWFCRLYVCTVVRCASSVWRRLWHWGQQQERTQKSWGLQWPLMLLSPSSPQECPWTHTTACSLAHEKCEAWSTAGISAGQHPSHGILMRVVLCSSFFTCRDLPPHKASISKEEQTTLQLWSLHRTLNNTMGRSVEHPSVFQGNDLVRRTCRNVSH